MVKRNLFRYSSVLMCVVLTAASLVGCGANTAATTGTDTAYVTEMAAGSTEAAITQAITNELAVSNKSTLATNTRQETVYVFNDASGNKNHITVNEKITDANGNETLNKTESSENAPVTMKVTYKLDGKEIKPEDLAGKSGKVTIRFDYTNNQKKTVTINGKKQTVTVPFTMITGMMLPTDVFSNVEVTNGKLTKVGDNIVAVGMTMPGLKDTMNLKFNDKSLDLDIPEYFELTADVKNFSLDMTMSVATSNLLSDMNADDITLDDLKKTVASLDDAATQLADGTVSLQDGTQQLSDAIPALTDGVDQLNTGASSLKDGIYAYADGAASAYEGSVSLNDNMKTYADGIGTLYNTLKDNNLDSSVASAADGASQLSAGAETLDTGIDSALAGAGALATGANDLTGGTEQLATGAAALADGANKIGKTLTDGMTEAKEKYDNAYESFYQLAVAVIGGKLGYNPSTMTDEQKIAAATALANEAGYGLSATADITNENQCTKAAAFIMQNYNDTNITTGKIGIRTAMVSALTAKYAAADTEHKYTLEQLKEKANSDADANLVAISSGLSQAYKAYGLLNDTMISLTAGGENSFFNGITKLNEGAGQVNTGANALKAGIDQLSAGAGQLSAGSKQLKAGLGTLSTGLNTLSTSVGSFSTYKEGTLCSSLYALNLNAGKLQQEGTAVLQSGLSQLTANNDTLKSGALQLADGTATLKDSSGTLADGVTQLNEGAITLKDGMAQFNSEAIEPITKLVDSDAQTVVDTIKAVVKAGQEYNSFLGKSDDKAGSVTFVYKTAGITANK
jgi:putative membrane protein